MSKWLVVPPPESVGFFEYGPGRMRNGAGAFEAAAAAGGPNGEPDAKAMPRRHPARVERRARRIKATLAQAQPEAVFRPYNSVIGLDDFRRGLDDEDLFAAVGIDLHHAVQKDALVVLHGDDAVHEDVLGERLILGRGGKAGLQGLDVPSMQLHRRASLRGSRRHLTRAPANHCLYTGIAPTSQAHNS